jgi:hypothetical protein
MTTETTVPDEFRKVIKDFVGDLKTTFPEYEPLIAKWWKDKSTFDYIENEEERTKAINDAEIVSTNVVFSFCQKKMPPRFFDILYKNEDMFKDDYEGDTEFLPHIHFKSLWQFDISQNTKDTIWKYLQLITFSIVGSLNNSEAFGDSAKLFEAINQDEFKNKLEETLSQMQGIFDMSGNFGQEGGENSGPNFNMGDMPNAEDINNHITGMLDGKLGKLAKEIAEETAENLNMDMENATDIKDVFQKLIKNPTKLMGLVKTVGDKLDTRIKSGEIKESELIAEATEMMNKMKNMPGMGNLQSMLNKMGMGNLGGLGGKVNTAAMESQLNKKMKTAQMKERMRAKAEAAHKAKMEQQNTSATSISSLAPTQQAISEEELLKIFSAEEKAERTPRGAKPSQLQVQPSSEGKKKKKGKK